MRFSRPAGRHADVVVCEGLPLAWSPEDGETVLGDVVSRLRVDSVEDGVVRGEMEYESGGETWRHAFEMRVFADDAELSDGTRRSGASGSTGGSTHGGSRPEPFELLLDDCKSLGRVVSCSRDR